ncbi:NAD(P)H oxidoreductase YRKL / Flavodoxin 2 [Pseudomonas sp. OF001]|uniref:NAD(P)H-dependent oxidoreductase n=1 Tax=unclassified Pseudomonas TaxID=196821 RepID=UPI001917F6F6|nr:MULTISPECIES: NAD(P)H-dependent oxidoreductase [unclassified Pseudomonas]WPP46328.1 NAD(P)H-dependent oxidoreductase [Pseudomonas sp. AN-1]CAD5378422.1 NAD(P)H oxidoreductase YRKL / Flavodoxin 2 [Pseudomonas sp. OF001]
MKVLIVHAHNEPRSFNSALKDCAVEQLSAAGHEVQVSDLHAMDWNPVASAADFGSRANPDYLVYALEQRHNYEAGTLAPDIAAEIAKVQWCDLLILNFPLYWFSTPAILKGWIDRVMISGVFYGGKRIYDRGGMCGKRALVTLTLGGREHMFGAGAIHGEIHTLLRPLLQGSLAYCGFAVLPPFIGYHVPYVSTEARGQILADYRQHLATLDNLEALRFPSLADYDERLLPLAR